MVGVFTDHLFFRTKAIATNAIVAGSAHSGQRSQHSLLLCVLYVKTYFVRNQSLYSLAEDAQIKILARMRFIS